MSETPVPTPVKRKPIKVAVSANNIVVIADDGSMWQFDQSGKWYQMPELPTKEGPAIKPRQLYCPHDGKPCDTTCYGSCKRKAAAQATPPKPLINIR